MYVLGIATAEVGLLSTTVLLVLSAASRHALVWPAASTWGLLILVGTADVAISRTLYYIALRRVKMSILSIALTVSPAVSVLWTLVLFGTVPTLQQLLGGAAVIAGALLLRRSNTDRTRQDTIKAGINA